MRCALVSGLLIIQAHLPLLSTGLAFFAADNFVIVLDALALVRLGRTLATNFCCKLADLLLVNTLNDDLVGVGNFDLDILGLGYDDLMRVADVQNEVLAFLSCTVTDAVDLEVLLKPSDTPTTMLCTSERVRP